MINETSTPTPAPTSDNPPAAPMTVKDIVREYLKENELDGLCHDDGCHCDTDEACNCYEPIEDCHIAQWIRKDSDKNQTGYDERIFIPAPPRFKTAFEARDAKIAELTQANEALSRDNHEIRERCQIAESTIQSVIRLVARFGHPSDDWGIIIEIKDVLKMVKQ